MELDLLVHVVKLVHLAPVDLLEELVQLVVLVLLVKQVQLVSKCGVTMCYSGFELVRIM